MSYDHNVNKQSLFQLSRQNTNTNNISRQEQSLSQKQRQRQNSLVLFNLPQINSKSYKETALQIHSLMSNLQNYTQNLQSKIDKLLYKQQQQFINSYKQHMTFVKLQFNNMEQQLLLLNSKIQYYQNQGRLSTLLKKVMKLQEENKKLLAQIVGKNKEIKSLQLGMEIDRKEIKRLQGKVKQFIKFKVLKKQEKQRESIIQKSFIQKQKQRQRQEKNGNTLDLISENKLKSNQNQNLNFTAFATEIIPLNTNHNKQAYILPNTERQIKLSKIKDKIPQKKLRQNYSIPRNIQNTINLQNKNQQFNSKLYKFLTQEQNNTLQLRSHHQKSQQATGTNIGIGEGYQHDLLGYPNLNPHHSYQISKLQKQIKNLKKQNSKLLLFSSKFLQSANSMQNFFFQTVNDIRRSISIRKKIKECSLQDFRKQDKLELLIRVLSNDEIIVYLHEKIFGQKDKIQKNIDNNGVTSNMNYQVVRQEIQRMLQGQNQIKDKDKQIYRKKVFSLSNSHKNGNKKNNNQSYLNRNNMLINNNNNPLPIIKRNNGNQ